MTKEISPKIPWIAAIFLTVLAIYSFADRQLPSIMIPELKSELDLSDGEIGFVYGTAFTIFFAIATVIFGRLADTANRRRILIFALILWSTLTGLCGIAQSFYDLVIFRIGVGIGEAALGPIALTIFAGYFDKDKLPIALGIFSTAPFLGSAIATWGGSEILTNIYLIKDILGPLSSFSDWRLTFFVFALPGFLFAFCLKYLPIPDRKEIKKVSKVSIIPYLKKSWKFYSVMFIGVTITGLVGYSVLGWGVEYMVRVHDLEKTVSGRNFAIFNLVFGVGGSIGAGFIAGNMIKKGILNAHLKIGSFIVLLIWVSLMLMTLSSSSLFSQSGLAGMILFMSCGPTLYSSAIQNASPEVFRGRTAAIYYISANVIGFALGPFALGILNDFIFNASNGYDETGIRYSLLWLGIILYPIAAYCFYIASKLFLPIQKDAIENY